MLPPWQGNGPHQPVVLDHTLPLSLSLSLVRGSSITDTPTCSRDKNKAPKQKKGTKKKRKTHYTHSFLPIQGSIMCGCARMSWIIYVCIWVYVCVYCKLVRAKPMYSWHLGRWRCGKVEKVLKTDTFELPRMHTAGYGVGV